jgi:hypothetical protein
MRFSPLSCYLVHLRPKYSIHHPILKHPQPTFLPLCVWQGQHKTSSIFRPVCCRWLLNLSLCVLKHYVDSMHSVLVYRFCWHGWRKNIHCVCLRVHSEENIWKYVTWTRRIKKMCKSNCTLCGLRKLICICLQDYNLMAIFGSCVYNDEMVTLFCVSV